MMPPHCWQAGPRSRPASLAGTTGGFSVMAAAAGTGVEPTDGAAVGWAGPHGMVACLFAITALFGMFISNTATAVLMAPVAIAVAKESGMSPYPFAMMVALAASAGFKTPISSPVNTLVSTAGNYSFGDFVKIGLPLAVMVGVVSVLLVPWLLPP